MLKMNKYVLGQNLFSYIVYFEKI